MNANISQEQLILFHFFKGSGYPQQFWPRIKSSIDEVLMKYPGLQLATYKTGAYFVYFFHGTLPIVYNNATYFIPLSIMLPQNFPKSGPLSSLNVDLSMIHSPNVNQNKRIVLPPNLFQWNQNLTICQYINAICTEFSKNLPIDINYLSYFTTPQPTNLRESGQQSNTHTNPLSTSQPIKQNFQPSNQSLKQQGRASNPDISSHTIEANVSQPIDTSIPLRMQKIREAQEKLDKMNQEIAKANKNLFYLHLFQSAEEIIDQIRIDSEKIQTDLEGQLKKKNSQDVPDLVIPEDIDKYAKAVSAQKAYQEVLDEYREMFQQNKISPEHYFLSIRKFSRWYFGNSVLQNIKP